MIRKRLFAVLASMLLVVAPSFANVASNTTSTPVNLSIAESVSLSLSTNNITLTTTSPSANVTLTTSWVLKPGHTSGKIYSWFTTLPTCGSCAGNPQITQAFFSTQYNGGAVTQCTQADFGTGFGFPTKNCGVFTLAQNVGTDLNDSASTTLTVNFNQQANTAPVVGTYTGGLLNILFQVV